VRSVSILITCWFGKLSGVDLISLLLVTRLKVLDNVESSVALNSESRCVNSTERLVREPDELAGFTSVKPWLRLCLEGELAL
jgi:hypothetical protein